VSHRNYDENLNSIVRVIVWGKRIRKRTIGDVPDQIRVCSTDARSRLHLWHLSGLKFASFICATFKSALTRQITLLTERINPCRIRHGAASTLQLRESTWNARVIVARTIARRSAKTMVTAALEIERSRNSNAEDNIECALQENLIEMLVLGGISII